MPFQEVLGEKARLTLWLLMGAAAFVMIISCANVANLTLMRGVRREQELVVRAALGAGAARLRRLLLAENLVLAFGGAVLGLVIAVGGVQLLVSLAQRYSPRANEIQLDGVVLGFTLAPERRRGDCCSRSRRAWPRKARSAAWISAGANRSSGGVRRQRLQRGARRRADRRVGHPADRRRPADAHDDAARRGERRTDDGTRADDGSADRHRPAERRRRARDVRPHASRGRRHSRREGRGRRLDHAAPLDTVPARRQSRGPPARRWAKRSRTRSSARRPRLLPRGGDSADQGARVRDHRPRQLGARRDPQQDARRRNSSPIATRSASASRGRATCSGSLACTSEWRTVVGVVGDTKDGGLDAEPRNVVFLPFTQKPVFQGAGLVIRAEAIARTPRRHWRRRRRGLSAASRRTSRSRTC